MTVIAMTREMGSRGREVAAALADRLDTDVIHHELIDMAGRAERPRQGSEVARHLAGSAASEYRWRRLAERDGYATELELLELAARGNAIIRGWGAARVLRRVPHVLAVRVCAPLERRVAEMARRLGLDESAARREIRRSDAAHESALAAFFGTDSRAPENYDVVLNTERVNPEEAADFLLSAARGPAFAETEASRRALGDRLTEARVARALHAEGMAARARDVHARCDNGELRLYGLVRDSGASSEIERLVRDLVPVAALRNEIASFRD